MSISCVSVCIYLCVQIEDHTFTVVELDGKPVVPVVMSSLLLNQGQRASLLLTADKEDGVYLISARTQSRVYEKAGSVRRNIALAHTYIYVKCCIVLYTHDGREHVRLMPQSTLEIGLRIYCVTMYEYVDLTRNQSSR